MERIAIQTSDIQLDQFLKLSGAIMTGGAVKPLMLERKIFVNGVPETARRKKLVPGDVVALETDDGKLEFQVSQ